MPRPRSTSLPAPAPAADTPSPAPASGERLYPIGTRQVSDETGEYEVDPATGRVIRKL